MYIEPNIKDLLIRSFEEELSPTDAARLKLALEKYPMLQSEQKKLQRMRQAIIGLRAENDPQFVENVMSRLKDRGRNTIATVMAAIFPKVAAACLMIFLLSLLAIYFSSGTLSIDAIIGVEELTPEDASIYLSFR